MFTPLLRELWGDIPRSPEPGSRDEVVAALAGGEARRASALLDAGASSDDQELRRALRYLARYLDRSWFPGPIGVVLRVGARPAARPEPSSDDPRRRLAFAQAVEHLPDALAQRSMAADSWANGDDAGTTLTNVTHSRTSLDDYRLSARAVGDAPAELHAVLLLADVARSGNLTGLGRELLATAAALAAPLGPAAEGCVALAVGDARLWPGRSPESLGVNLGLLAEPATVVGAPAARRAADRHYRRARRRFEAAGTDRGVAAADLRIAAVALAAGRPRDAIGPLTRAVTLFESSGDRAGWALASVHALLARIAAGSTAAGRAARLAPVVRWANTWGSRSFGIGCARLVTGTGTQWRRSGDLDAALVAYDLGAELARLVDDPDGRWAAETAAGEAYAALNSHGATIATLEEGLDDFLAPYGGLAADGPLDVDPWFQVVQRLTALSGQATNEGDPDGLIGIADRMGRLLARSPLGPLTADRPGADFLARVEAVGRRLDNIRMTSILPPGAPDDEHDWVALLEATIEHLAVGLIDTIHAMQMLAELRRAQDLAREGRVGAAAAGYAAALAAAEARGAAGTTMAAIVLDNAGRRDEAADRVEDFLTSTPDVHPDYAAQLWLGVDRPDEAAAALRAGGAEAVPPAGREWARDWREARLRGQIELAAGRVPAARRLLAEGMDRFERRFAQVPGDAFRVSLADDPEVRQLYHAGAAAAVADDDHATAFVHADRPRLLPIAALLDEQAAGRGSPAQLRWREAQARLTGAFDRRRAAWRLAAVGGPDLTVTGDELRKAKDRFRRAEAAVETEAAAGTGSDVVPPSRPTPRPPLDFGDVQAGLDDDSVLISYLLDEAGLLVFGVTRSTVQGHRFELDGRALTGTVSRAHAGCRGRPVEDVAPLPDLDTDLAALADRLLDPVRTEIDGHRRVVVVPFGALHLLPFHVLPFGGGRLGDDRVVSHLPTALLVPRLVGRRAPRLDGGAAVVGDPATHAGRGLRRLPGAAVEASAVGRALGATPLLDTRATARAVRKTLPGKAIVHLATHGVLDEVAPTLSSLALAGPDELTVAQLMGLDLDADLVVLSACDTGRGDITGAGDVVGLARGLLAAGARHAVVSLWPVDDVAACLTMTTFSERLAAGDPVGDALATARNDLRTRSQAEREARFDALAAAHNRATDDAGPRSRDGLPPEAGTGDPGHPTWWAPFVHIGI